MTQDLLSLNRRFSIGEELLFTDRGNGFLVAEISNMHCSASIALNGAHLLSWIPRGEEPAIWISEDATFENGRSIRGGIPVCWPWFGAHPIDSSYPDHGFARTSIWEITTTDQHEDGSISIDLKLDVPAGYPLWPFATGCVISFRLGNTLDISLTTHNYSLEPLIIGQALHTYFNIGDIYRCKLHGLEGRNYLDKPSGFSRKQQHGEITFNGEVDRIYLDTPEQCLIEDSVLKRTIRIEKTGSRSTIVWNPWIQRAAEMGDLGENGYRNMLCVESANAAQDVVTLAPQANHTLGIRYTIT